MELSEASGQPGGVPPSVGTMDLDWVRAAIRAAIETRLRADWKGSDLSVLADRVTGHSAPAGDAAGATDDVRRTTERLEATVTEFVLASKRAGRAPETILAALNRQFAEIPELRADQPQSLGVRDEVIRLVLDAYYPT